MITGMLAVNLLRERCNVVPVFIDADGTFYSSAEMRSVEDFRDFSAKKFPAVALDGRALVHTPKTPSRIFFGKGRFVDKIYGSDHFPYLSGRSFKNRIQSPVFRWKIERMGNFRDYGNACGQPAAGAVQRGAGV